METMQQALQKLMEQKEQIDQRRHKIARREQIKARTDQGANQENLFTSV